jgi:hypothetical protein
MRKLRPTGMRTIASRRASFHGDASADVDGAESTHSGFPLKRSISPVDSLSAGELGPIKAGSNASAVPSRAREGEPHDASIEGSRRR